MPGPTAWREPVASEGVGSAGCFVGWEMVYRTIGVSFICRVAVAALATLICDSTIAGLRSGK